MSELQIGDWVICTLDNVVGRIIRFHTTIDRKEEIVVITRNGKLHHAPVKSWKRYHFGLETGVIFKDEEVTPYCDVPDPTLNVSETLILRADIAKGEFVSCLSVGRVSGSALDIINIFYGKEAEKMYDLLIGKLSL